MLVNETPVKVKVYLCSFTPSVIRRTVAIGSEWRCTTPRITGTVGDVSTMIIIW